MNKPIYLWLQILDLIKIVMFELWYNYVKSNMVKMKNLVLSIHTASLIMQRQVILQKMLKQDLTLEVLK